MLRAILGERIGHYFCTDYLVLAVLVDLEHILDFHLAERAAACVSHLMGFAISTVRLIGLLDNDWLQSLEILLQVDKHERLVRLIWLKMLRVNRLLRDGYALGESLTD